VQGRFKVFMIDEVHMLTGHAFNAMLKTLEEPPEYLKFVLATTDPQKVPVTVLSRCLQFNLRPMAPDTVREHLQHVLGAENVPFDEGALRLLGRAARGSMRDGLSLTDQAIAYGGGQLSEDVVRTMLGAVDRGHARALVDALSRRDGVAVLAAVDGLRSRGLSAAATLEEIARLLQQMAVEQAVPGALDAQDPDSEDARALVASLTPDETQLLYSMVLHGRGELSLMSDEYGALTMVLLRFLAFPAAGTAPAPAPRALPLRAPSPPAMAVVKPAVKAAPLPPSPPWDVEPQGAPLAPAPRRPSAPSPVSNLALPPQPSAPSASAAPTVITQDAVLAERWNGVVKALTEQGSIAALVRELAQQAGLTRIDDTQTPPRWLLTVAREPLRQAALSDKLAAALSTHLGTAVALEVQPGQPSDTPALRDTAERNRRQAAAEATIQQDPVVLELMNQFKTARIVPGSIKPI
jgi:DNA polymerase-3 subunit gamma/tau